MPNGRPGDSRVHDIVHLGLTVYGPQVDALVRDLEPRIPEADRAAFLTLIESWPFLPHGEPREPEKLLEELVALRARLGPAPPWPRLEPLDAVPKPLPPPGPRRRGSFLAALIGLAIGGAVGLPIGFIAYVAARETGLLPQAHWSSEAVTWGIALGVAGLCALLGALQGGAPTRAGHALLVAVLGFLVASLVCGLVAGVLAFLVAAVMGSSQREGGFAMGVVFGLVPIAAVLGGLLAALWTGRRAWRDYRR